MDTALRPGARVDAALDGRNAQIVDVVPTIADLLDIETPRDLDGISLLDEPRPGDGKPMLRLPSLVQAEPEALLEIDGARGLATLLASGPEWGEGDFEHAARITSPRSDLLGRQISKFDLDEPAATRAAIFGADDFASVDPNELPSVVTGSLDAAASGSVVVATLDGVIAGTSEVFADAESEHRFSMYLLPDQLEPGPNDFRLYLLDGDAAFEIAWSAE